MLRVAGYQKAGTNEKSRLQYVIVVGVNRICRQVIIRMDELTIGLDLIQNFALERGWQPELIPTQHILKFGQQPFRCKYCVSLSAVVVNLLCFPFEDKGREKHVGIKN